MCMPQPLSVSVVWNISNNQINDGSAGLHNIIARKNDDVRYFYSAQLLFFLLIIILIGPTDVIIANLSWFRYPELYIISTEHRPSVADLRFIYGRRPLRQSLVAWIRRVTVSRWVIAPFICTIQAINRLQMNAIGHCNSLAKNSHKYMQIYILWILLYLKINRE